MYLCAWVCGGPVHSCICGPAGAADCSWATGFNGPLGVALDPSSGALFVANYYTNTVCRVPPGGGADDPRAHDREGSRGTGRQGQRGGATLG